MRGMWHGVPAGGVEQACSVPGRQAPLEACRQAGQLRACAGTHLGACGQGVGAQLRHVDAVVLALICYGAAEVHVVWCAPAAAVAQDCQHMLKQAAAAVDEDAICVQQAEGWCGGVVLRWGMRAGG